MDIAEREAVVRECQMGVSSLRWIGAVEDVDVMAADAVAEFASWSLVEAIWVRREARSFRRSVVGKVWMSTGGSAVDDEDDDECSEGGGGGGGVGGRGGVCGL